MIVIQIKKDDGLQLNWSNCLIDPILISQGQNKISNKKNITGIKMKLSQTKKLNGFLEGKKQNKNRWV